MISGWVQVGSDGFVYELGMSVPTVAHTDVYTWELQAPKCGLIGVLFLEIK